MMEVNRGNASESEPKVALEEVDGGMGGGTWEVKALLVESILFHHIKSIQFPQC